MLDRRATLLGLAGVAGAGVSLRLSQGGLPLGGAATSAGAARAQPPLREQGAVDFSRVMLSQIPIGGGGFVTGIDVSNDGQRLMCRTDVANAYVRDTDAGHWRPFFSPSTMQPADYHPPLELNGKSDGEGVAGIRIAPSNKNVMVASYRGYMWLSTDGGRSVRRTRLGQKAMPANAGGQRLFNRIIDIHPQDPRQMIVGTWGEGTWFTSDGGEHWEQAKLPQAGKSRDGQPGISLVLFDLRTPRQVYVFVTGVGLCGSEEGPGGEFQLISGGPTFCSNLVGDAAGTVYLCEQSTDNSGHIWRYSPATGWASSKPEHEANTVAVDPRQPQRLVASNPNGFFLSSPDGGASWHSIGPAAWSRSVGEVVWTRQLRTLFPAEIRFDPQMAGDLWIAQGVGVANASASSGKVTLQDYSAGIEELCAVSALVTPSGKTFLSAFDKSFWRVDDLSSYTNDFRYPQKPGQARGADLVAYGSYMDHAGDNPNFVVGIIAPSAESAPGFTADGGESWQAFAGVPGTGWGVGGCIAASTEKNFVLLPSNNAVGAYTLDGGQTWSPVKLDGVQPTGGFANAYYVTRKNISADKTRPGVFALVYTVMQGNDYGQPLGGVWRTSDGGKTWTQVFKGVVDPDSGDPRGVRARGLEERQFWQCQLDYVPGRSGEIVYTPHADYAKDRFYWSQDDGASWSELHPSIRNVRSFGFGKPLAGQARPALYFWGETDGKRGLYASLDWFASKPRLVTRSPSQMLATISSVTGDPNVFGRVIVGTSCAGWVKAEISV